MKIFVTSDIHGNSVVIEKIHSFAAQRPDIEYILLCGDITSDYRAFDYEWIQAEQDKEYFDIVTRFKAIGKKVVSIRGNHDTFDLEEDEETYLINNKYPELSNFIGIEYINFHMYGTTRELSEEGIERKLLQLNINKQTILISHIPPYNCLNNNKSGPYKGSVALRNIIKEIQPKMLFFGHVHEGFGVKKLYKTLVFNVACDKNIARGWIVDTSTKKYEKIVLS